MANLYFGSCFGVLKILSIKLQRLNLPPNFIIESIAREQASSQRATGREIFRTKKRKTNKNKRKTNNKTKEHKREVPETYTILTNLFQVLQVQARTA